MKLTKLHLFMILALALILCPVLGVCSNSSVVPYNYSEGFVSSGSETSVGYDSPNFANPTDNKRRQ